MVSLLILAATGITTFLSSHRVRNGPSSTVKMQLPEPLKPAAEIDKLSPIQRIAYYNSWINVHPSAINLDSFEAHRGLARELRKIDPLAALEHVRFAHKIVSDHMIKMIGNRQPLEVLRPLTLLKSLHVEYREPSDSIKWFPDKNCLTRDLEQIRYLIRKNGEDGMIRPLNSCRTALTEEYRLQRHYSKALTLADETLEASTKCPTDRLERSSLLLSKALCLSHFGRKAEALPLLQECIDTAEDLTQLHQLISAGVEMEEWSKTLNLCTVTERMHSKEHPLARKVDLTNERVLCFQRLGRYREAFDLLKDKLATVSGVSERLSLWCTLVSVDRAGWLGESTSLVRLLKKEIAEVPALTPTEVTNLLAQIVASAQVAAERNEGATALNYLRLIFVLRQKWPLPDFLETTAAGAIACAVELTGQSEYRDAEDILREINWRIRSQPGKYNDLLFSSNLQLLIALSKSLSSPAEGLIIARQLEKLDSLKNVDFRLLARTSFYQRAKRYQEVRNSVTEILSNKQVLPRTKAYALTHLASIEAEQGHYVLAEKNLQLAFKRVSKEIPAARLTTLAKAAKVYAQMKQLREAGKCIDDYLTIARRDTPELLPLRLKSAAEMCENCNMLNKSVAQAGRHPAKGECTAPVCPRHTTPAKVTHLTSRVDYITRQICLASADSG